MLKRIMNTFRPDQRKDLIKGRTIAGNIMLDTIFDLLRSWSETNLRSFVVQLRQFFKVFSEPFVYEETHKKWDSLNYGKDEVSGIRNFQPKYAFYLANKNTAKKGVHTLFFAVFLFSSI